MNGILLFNKPILWTSHDAVDFVRRRAGQKAVGHAGTLDPMATGLLVLLLGKATKLSQNLSVLDKDYAGTMTLGMETDTQDLEGRILNPSHADLDRIREEEIQKVFLEMEGRQIQVPPMFSSVRKDGKKLYEWARKGVAVEAKGRDIVITQFHVIEYNPPEVYFFLRCSKGTYVRTLVDKAGKKLGCGAVLSALARTRVGHFHLSKALTEEEVCRLSPEELEKKLVT